MSKLKHKFHDVTGTKVYDHPIGEDGKPLKSSVSKAKPTSKPAVKPR